MAVEELLLYDGEPKNDSENNQPWRFEDLGISDAEFWAKPEQEQRREALEKIKEITDEYMKKLVKQSNVPLAAISLKVHAADSPEEILVKAQEMKKLADANKYEQFVAAAEQGTVNTKQDMLAEMMKQLDVKDTKQLGDRVKELKHTNEQYEWVDSFRKAFKMIKINKIKKNLAETLKKDPKKAMNKMIWLSTNWVAKKTGLKVLGFHMRNKNRIITTTSHITKQRIQDVQWIVDTMKKDFSDYSSMYDLFIQVGNEYLKSQSILGEIK